jgi:gamma-glutamyltranspeptidase/glutathione hydrolase
VQARFGLHIRARARRLVESVALAALIGCGSTTPHGTPPGTSAGAPSTSIADASASTGSAAPQARASDRGAVATENPAVADIALQVLREGGNAADAAIAAVLLAGFAQPASTGLGGDGFAVIWDAAKKTSTVIDFRARAPAGMKMLDHLGRETPEKKRGTMVGMPGVVAGLAALRAAAASRSWTDLVNLVAATAAKGVVVSPYAAQSFAWLAERPADADLLASFGLDAGSTDRTGQTIKDDALVATLRAIASDPGAFYRDDIQRDITDTITSAGGKVAPSDFKSYAAVTREALDVKWAGYDVLLPPSPCGGGFVVGEMLGLFAEDDARALGFDTANYVHFLSEGLRTSGEDRIVAIGDPDFTKVDPATFLAPDRLAERRKGFKSDATTMPQRMSLGRKGTFHVSVVDAHQNAVSITTTVGDLFGARLVTKGGFVLNDALVDFTMDDYGQRLTNRGPNFPRGGARPVSPMAPAIVVKDGELVSVLGASGGSRIPAAVTETIFAHLVFGQSMKDAVAAPRFTTSPTGTLLLDSGLANLADDLTARGEVIEDRAGGDFAAVSAIAVGRDGALLVLEAAGDPRKHGVGLVEAGPPPK